MRRQRYPKTTGWLALFAATCLVCAGCSSEPKKPRFARLPGSFPIPVTQPAEPYVVDESSSRSMTVIQRDVVFSATVPPPESLGGLLVGVVMLKNAGQRNTPSGYILPAERSFQIDVEDANGVSVERINVGDPATQPSRNTVTLPSLLPGETMSATYELQKLFRLDVPGRYWFLAASNMAGEAPEEHPVVVRVPFTILPP